MGKILVFKENWFLLSMVLAFLVIVPVSADLPGTFNPDGEAIDMINWAPTCNADPRNNSLSYFVYQNETLTWEDGVGLDYWVWQVDCHPGGGTDWQNNLGSFSKDGGTLNFTWNSNAPVHYTFAYVFFNQSGLENKVWYMYNATATRPSVKADFNYTINGYQVSFMDNSTGGVVNRIWNFGEGNTSTETNPVFTYSGPGLYGVNLYVNNSQSSDEISKDISIGENQSFTYHLLLDVKKADGSLMTSANIGIYDQSETEWRNATCLSGACGFMDSGPSHEHPLAFGKGYTLAAWKNGYVDASESITFSYDYQKVTLILNNVTNYTDDMPHLDIDVVEASTHYGIDTPDISLKDEVVGDWYNVTCESTVGACGFVHAGTGGIRNLEYGRDYTIVASKEGFLTVSETIGFTHNHQLVTLELPATWANYTMHLGVQIKDGFTGNWIEGADIGIYDPVYGEWRNATCIYGECGFMDSGSTHQYPLMRGNQYGIYAGKSGYQGEYKIIVFSQDYQVVPFYLIPNTVIVTPVTSRPLPTPYPTLTPLVSTNVSLDLSMLNISVEPFPTLNTTLMDVPSITNVTIYKNYALQNIPLMAVILTFEDGIITTIQNIIMKMMNTAGNPIMTVANIGLFVENVIQVIVTSFSGVISIITDIIVGLWNHIPFKVQLWFFLAMSVDTVFVLFNLGAYLKRQGGD